MIPSTGWLTVLSTGGLPLDFDLPVPMQGVYLEGGSIMIAVSGLGFRQVAAHFILSSVSGRFGYSDAQERMLRITLEQPKIFGVLLLDSFTPPEIAQELWDYLPYTQLACILGVNGEPPDASSCIVGSDLIFGDCVGEPLGSFGDCSVGSANLVTDVVGNTVTYEDA